MCCLLRITSRPGLVAIVPCTRLSLSAPLKLMHSPLPYLYQVSAISRSIALVLDATSTDSAHEGRRDSGMLGTWQPSLQQQQQSATRSPALPSSCTQWWDVLAAVEVLVAGIAESGSSENQVTPSLLAAVCRWCTAQLAAQPRLNHNLAWDILSAQNQHQGQQRRQREALTWRDRVCWLHSSLLDTAALDVAARCSPEQVRRCWTDTSACFARCAASIAVC